MLPIAADDLLISSILTLIGRRALPHTCHRCYWGLSSVVNWQGLVSVMYVSILFYSLTMTPEEESGGEQPLHPYRAPCMDAAGRDSHFSP